MLRLLKLIMKATGSKGVPQGGVISPLLSNIYLTEVDRMLERAREVTRTDRWTRVQYARFADDIVVMVDGRPEYDRLFGQVSRRLREELALLEIEVNEEKTKSVDLGKRESFDFLGFQIRRVRSQQGKWFPLCRPLVKKRTALIRRLREIFRAHQSQPVRRVIVEINPILRGWVAYSARGHSSQCFSFVRQWVEKKVRRHLARNSKRHGFGWKRWSTQWLYTHLGLFGAYQVQWKQPMQKALPAG